MFSLAMGGLSAASLGFADFIASQSSKRIGAARALMGMLLISSTLLTILMIAQNGFDGLFTASNTRAIGYSILHGVLMAVALLMFFYAMSVGKISVVAPIIAAHPVVIVAFYSLQGDYLTVGQLLSIAGVLLGVSLVAAAEPPQAAEADSTKNYEKLSKVLLVSVCSSLVYGGAIIALQEAASGIGDLQVLWFGRCVGLVTISTVLLTQKRARLPRSAKWYLIFFLHGSMDSGGMLFILLGIQGSPGGALVAVVASTFPVITVALAWLILKERLSRLQLFGTAIVVVGVSVLVGCQ